MLTFVLDASAVIRYFDNEPGSARVKEILKDCRSGRCRVLMSAVNWGELVGMLAKQHGIRVSEDLTARLLRNHVEVITVTADRASRAAQIKLSRKIPYADAFAAELAGDSPQHVLVTADFDFKPAAQDIAVEFLPTKPKS